MPSQAKTTKDVPFEPVTIDELREGFEDWSEADLQNMADGLNEDLQNHLNEQYEALHRLGKLPVRIRVRDTEHGVRYANGFRFLRNFCERFIKQMEVYAGKVEGDWWPFQYGERPLIGFLAAGVWACRGGVCIEEYSLDRKPGIKEDPTKPKYGRGDLYFLLGKEEGNIEAKVWNVGISEPRDRAKFKRYIMSKWRSIRREALSAKIGTAPGRYGSLFLRPYLGKSPDAALYKANLKQLIEWTWEMVKPEVMCWWCPLDEILQDDDHEQAFAGVVLLIKRAS